MNKPQPNPLPPEVSAAIERGHLSEAIKLLREARGLGLKEAKEAVDAMKQALPKAAAMEPGHEDGLAPGEQRQHTGLWVAVVVAALLGLLAYRWIQG